MSIVDKNARHVNHAAIHFSKSYPMPKSRPMRIFVILRIGTAEKGATLACALVLLTFPLGSYGHAFVQPYSLPVPFSMYSTAAGVALALSFAAIAVFARPRPDWTPHTAVTTAAVLMSEPDDIGLSQLLSTSLLLLCIASGLVGTKDSSRNINMTMFWIVLVLLVPYVVSVFGDFYRSINPWRGILRIVEFGLNRRFEGYFQYPRGLGYFPALALYIAFICIELFGSLRPFGLSIYLLAYTVIIVGGAILFGRELWLSHAEFFGVQFSLLGRIAPLRRLSRSRPDDGAVPASLSLVLVVLFMLSSTAFDGLHATRNWVLVYWTYIYGPVAGVTPPADKYAAAALFYQVWQWVTLIASPFLYLGVFAFFVWLSKMLGGARGGGSSYLMCTFARSLLPIALVYHVSHYYTLVLWQLPLVVKLLSDPFGLGWNLFGTSNWDVKPWVVDVGTIWHTQVFLIVGGHIWSVVLSHLEAIRQFGKPGAATLSQIPMLVLMVALTTFGLWILSLPLA
ncbi:hypothetical protein [Paraburkholderia youngii]|uniref:hypothetical protein n=1 Tax=Paraburkholderia youngii TaxID=2782701 RepID=UPI001591D8E6|nr:hypothetical protein [Paraburkholderia youngii]NUX57619.1 hypothetical protein [Paraburkholderia youngii]